MELSDLATKLTTPVNAKLAIKKALTDLSITVPDSSTFRNFANLIYNIGVSSAVTLVEDSTIDTTGLSVTEQIYKKLEYLYCTTIWIKTAIRARGVDTSGKSLADYATLVSSITTTSPVLKKLNMTMSAGTASYTAVFATTDTIDSTHTLKYKITTDMPLSGTDVNTWDTLDTTKSYTFDPNSGNSFVCVVEADSSNLVVGGCMIEIVYKNPAAPGTLTITSAAGTTGYGYTALTVSPTLTSGNKYYYSTTVNEIYAGDTLATDNYTEWDGSAELYFDSAINIQLVECTTENVIVNAGTVLTVLKTKPTWFTQLTVTSVAGSDYGKTTITVSPKLLTGNKYYYKLDAVYDDNTDVEKFDSTGYTEWNGTDDIEATTGQSILIVDTSGTNIEQSGSTTVTVKEHVIGGLVIASVAGSSKKTTSLSVSPTLTEGDLYFYKVAATGTDMPAYNETIDPTGYTSWDGTSDIYIANNTRILLIETTSARKALNAGYATVVSAVAYTDDLVITSTASSTVIGATKLAVVPVLTSGNRYRYCIGYYPVSFDMDVSSNSWYDWDGSSEISGISSGSILTIVEANSSFLAKKYGLVSITTKPEELLTLTFSAIKGSSAGYTNILNGNAISAGNHYVYKLDFDISIVILNYDASGWISWVGQEIQATADEVIAIAEVNSANQVKKIGSVKAVVKEADPVLGSLTVTSVASGTEGYTKLTISPTLTSGYSYKYALDTSIPSYHQDLTLWTSWDGTSDIKATNGATICVAEVTSDYKACKGGVTAVVSTVVTSAPYIAPITSEVNITSTSTKATTIVKSSKKKSTAKTKSKK